MHSADPTPQDSAQPAGEPKRYRVPDYLARVDAHLATLWPVKKQVEWLEALLDGWNRAAREFERTGRAGKSSRAHPPHAADFHLTIIGLHGRYERLLLELRRP